MTDAPAKSRAAVLADWALGLSIALIVPGLPLVGAALGVAALLQLQGGPEAERVRTKALGAILIGSLAGLVSLAAILTVIAPGTLGVGWRARRLDAQLNLHAIERGIYAFHAEHGTFPVGDTGWTPETPCCEQRGRVCRLEPQEWSVHPLWSQLEFVPLAAPTHQLRYDSDDGQTFIVRARGDIACDGNVEVVRLRGEIGPTGNVVSEPLEHDLGGP